MASASTPVTLGGAPVRHTTLSDLRHYLTAEINHEFKKLPPARNLRLKFVSSQEIHATFSNNFPIGTNVITKRLYLGYAKDLRSDGKHEVCAYLYEKEGISKVNLRFGKRTLKAQDLEEIEFVPPFDRIYDAYGMTDRACDRLSIMAAYYFLANGILDKISTRSKDFRITLRNLCVKIFKTAVSDKNEGGDDIHNTITGIEPAVSINAQKEQTTSIRSKSSCNGIALSTMEQLSLIDFSEAAHQASSSMSEDETLADKTENARISAPITEERTPASHPPTPAASPSLTQDTNTPEISDLKDIMKFIESYKALKFANHTLTTEAQQQADRLANLNNRAKQSACTNTLLESNIRRLQDAKKHDALANLVQTKDLQTAAEDAKAKAANLSTILQEENKNHGVTQARLVDAQKEIETQKCEGEKAVRDIHFLNENLRTLESTIENLEDKTSTLDRENKKLGSRVGELVKQNTTLTSEVARLKAAEVPVGIHIENMGLKKRVAALEGENTELKGKFEEFGRLIRGCGV